MSGRRARANLAAAEASPQQPRQKRLNLARRWDPEEVGEQELEEEVAEQELEEEDEAVIIVMKAASNGAMGGWKAGRLELLPGENGLFSLESLKAAVNANALFKRSITAMTSARG